MITHAEKERARYWPVSKELMAQYNDGSYANKNSCGDLFWRENGKLHRDGDLPAIIYADGSLCWRQNGKRHRDEDKPAVIQANGKLQWWKNDKKHRLCGSAIILEDSNLEWWINGKEITQEVNAWLAGEEWQGTPERIVEFQLRFT